MATAGNLLVNILGSTKGFEQSLVKSQKMLDSFVGTATKMFGALAGGFTIGKALGEAFDLESSLVQFKVLLGDMDRAKNLVGELRGFAAETPFAFGDIANSSKLLLNAGVAMEDMVPTLRMLGDLAAAGGKDIGDLAFVFAQVRTAGRLMGQDLNQLLNANIPAIRLLAEEFGVAENEVRDLVSTGAVTFDRLQNALLSATSAGGQLHGMTQQLSQTSAGLWSTLKDNVNAALGELGGYLIKNLHLNEAMQGATILIEQFGSTAGAVAGVVGDGFSIMFEAIGLKGATSFDGIMEIAVGLLAGVEYVFDNIGKYSELAFTGMHLSAVTAFNEITHFFSVSVPELLSWFGENWESVFFTAFDLTTTMLVNFGQNVRDIMGEIWSFISSGGTDELELTWEPLTKGFHNAISQLPELTERELSEVEKLLAAQSDQLGKELGGGLVEHMQKRMQELLPQFQLGTSGASVELDRSRGMEKALDAAGESERMVEETRRNEPVKQKALTAVSGMDAIREVNEYNREQAYAKEKADADRRHKEMQKFAERQTKAAEASARSIDEFVRSVTVAEAVI